MALIAAIAVLTMTLAATSAEALVNPVLSGSTADSTTTLPGATAVAISGHYAYVTGYYAGKLAAIDISNPASPVVAGASQESNGLLNASTINIAGGYAYVVSKNRNGTAESGSNDDGTGNSLTILDIATNPASPTIVGSVRDPSQLFGAYGVAMSGQYAFVASQGCLSGQPCPNASVGNGFAVVDMSIPASPLIVASIRNNKLPAPWTGTGALSHATSVAISGNYAYVTAAYQDRLTVINIADPLNPTIVASIRDTTNLNFPVDVAVSGNYAYVTDQITTGRLAVVDVSNPNNPQMLTSLASSSFNGAYRVRIRGSFAYVSASALSSVAVVDISSPASPRIAATVGSVAHLNKTTGLDVDPTGRYVVASSPFLSTQTQPLYPPFALQAGGPTLTGSVSAITLDPLTVAATITPASEPSNPTAQTSASFNFSVNDAVAAVQCKLDSGSWLPCTTYTSQTYTSLGAGSHTFAVQATDAAGKTSTATFTWTVTAPANTSLPEITGSASVGQVLSTSTGSWTGSPSFSYQWSRCEANGMSCSPIPGAISSSYTVEGTDAASTLRARVTATTSAGATSAESSPTAAVTSAPVNTAAPTISGTATQGQLLSASTGSWSGYPPPSFAYQWQRCDQSGSNCNSIGEATASTYTPVAADVGSTLVVVVTATNSVGSAGASSAATPITSGPPASTSAPTISGSATQGQVLSASTGSWSGYPPPSFTYQWQRCDQSGSNCNPISEATAQTYTLAAADVGSTVAVLVTATNSSGSAQASSATSAVISGGPVNTAPPAVSGSATEGQMLSGSTGTWSGYPAPSFTYQWQRCNSSGQACAPITGATASTYTALSADVGSTLLVTVTATNSVSSAQANSAPSPVVVSAAGPVTGLLDDFARANNSGPPGPNWTHMVVSSTGPTNDLFITNHQVTGRSGSNADYWNPQAYGPNSEVWVTVAVKPTLDQDPVVLGLRFQNPGAANAGGYQAYYIFRSGQADQYRIISRTNGTTSTTLASVNGPTLSPGDELLFRAIGTTLELWRLDAGTWTRILSATDSTFQSAGYLNLTARDGTVRLTNFGGGTLP